mgnify:CR=1 FL=1
MFNWEGRILDNKSIMAVKAALPFLDIPVGEVIDLEGLLRAVRCFCRQQEQRMIDMLLQFFMMKRMMSMMTLFQEAQNSDRGMEGIIDLLKSQVPKEQQDMFDMMSMMMSMQDLGAGMTGEPGMTEESGGQPEAAGDSDMDAIFPDPVPEPQADMQSADIDAAEEEPLPEIWQRIAENIDKGTEYDRSEGYIQEHAPGKGTDHPGTGAEDERQGNEEFRAAYHGGDAEVKSPQSFFFPGGGNSASGDSHEGYERRRKAEGGNDETGY